MRSAFATSTCRGVLLGLLLGACTPSAESLKPQAPIVGEDTFASDGDSSAESAPLPDDGSPADRGWPRVMTSGDLQLTVYQPQVETWLGNRIRSRAAVSVQTAASAVPTFGVVWLSARTDVDRETRLVRLEDIKVERTSFPSAPARAEELAEDIRQHMPKGGVYVALDRLQASLAVTRAESKHPTVQVRNDPPRFFFSTRPSLLVLVDGQPVLRGAGRASLLRVINTRALLLLDRPSGRYYLSVGSRWLTAPEIAGPWAEAEDLPPDLAVGLDRAREAASREQLVDLLNASGTPLTDALSRNITPTVYVATGPAELLETDGPPQWAPIAGTGLLEATNTTSDLFFAPARRLYYVVVSGRWYATDALDKGPWAFVPSKSLPAEFSRIPETHPKGSVLSSVAGTPEAEQALIANEIPQTATIDRATAQLSVAYDGAPAWAPIEGTALKYASNASTPVVQTDATTFYAVSDGVWFTSSMPAGPWVPAAKVPDAIYDIPPSSPVYNVTYVRVYDSTPDVIYEGYTPGYFDSFVSDDDVVVYGTGYDYPCWASEVWIGSPWTFGFDVGWAPGFYWGFGWGYGAGLAVGLREGSRFHPWWGPAGWGWGRHNPSGGHNAQQTNLYRTSWARSVVSHAWDRSEAARADSMRSIPAFSHVYAGSNGEVYRASPNGSWERSTGAGWQRATPTPDLGRERTGRQLGGTQYQLFRRGGYPGGGYHGGGRR